MTQALACQGVSVDYGSVRTLDHLDLGVDEGQAVALLGPSGSGKSTLMYAIAGFVQISTGTIDIGGDVMSTPSASLPPDKRPVALVFQNYALWPHLTAEATVAYPLRRAGATKSKALAEARELLDVVGIGALAGRKPAELSGGEQQRVGLARALARDTRLYLFDEPTAHLDSSVRGAVQEVIASRRAASGGAAVYATHDSAEALAIADRVAIIRDGSVVQLASPHATYEQPIDVWAARLTGPASVFEVEVMRSGEAAVTVALGDGEVVAACAEPGLSGRVMMLVRPDWVALDGPVRAVVRDAWFRGPHTDYRLETRVGMLEARFPGAQRLDRGDVISCSIERGWIPRQS